MLFNTHAGSHASVVALLPSKKQPNLGIYAFNGWKLLNREGVNAWQINHSKEKL